MTTEITSQLPHCPLPDCEGGEHHFHDVEAYAAEEDKTHDCATHARDGFRCYGPHRPGLSGPIALLAATPQWEPIEPDQIKAGMRIRTTIQYDDRATIHVGVAHHQVDGLGIWVTEKRRPLDGWGDSTTYEVDPATIPDPDAELIDALREASWLIENSGERPDPLPGLPEARDLLNKLRELGWTVIREESE